MLTKALLGYMVAFCVRRSMQQMQRGQQNEQEEQGLSQRLCRRGSLEASLPHESSL
ncbi:unnamed protein product [Pylaiella littoralis]